MKVGVNFCEMKRLLFVKERKDLFHTDLPFDYLVADKYDFARKHAKSYLDIYFGSLVILLGEALPHF